MKRIAILDDHSLFRAGTRALLEISGQYQVVAEAARAAQAIMEFPASRPDILLVDISLPDCSGIEFLQELALLPWPEQRPGILMISMHNQREFVVQAFQHGAHAYLLKESAPEQLIAAIEQVAKRQRWISPELGSPEDYIGKTSEDIPLTPRQMQVLRLLASGQTVKRIADELGISPKTVQTFRNQIMERLQIRDIPGLVRFAMHHGIIT